MRLESGVSVHGLAPASRNRPGGRRRHPALVPRGRVEQVPARPARAHDRAAARARPPGSGRVPSARRGLRAAPPRRSAHSATARTTRRCSSSARASCSSTCWSSAARRCAYPPGTVWAGRRRRGGPRRCVGRPRPTHPDPRPDAPPAAHRTDRRPRDAAARRRTHAPPTPRASPALWQAVGPPGALAPPSAATRTRSALAAPKTASRRPIFAPPAAPRGSSPRPRAAASRPASSIVVS